MKIKLTNYDTSEYKLLETKLNDLSNKVIIVIMLISLPFLNMMMNVFIIKQIFLFLIKIVIKKTVNSVISGY